MTTSLLDPSLDPLPKLHPDISSPTDATTPDPATATAAATRAGSDRFVLFPARAFLALGWFRAGVEKVIEPDWWTGERLERFLDAQESEMLTFMEPITATLVEPAPALTAATVAVVEIVLGVALITGRRLVQALLAASALNVIFVLVGVVTPSAFYLVIQLTLLLAAWERSGRGQNRHRIGIVAGCAITMVALAPFVTTLAPVEVIEDPAIMLITVAALAAAGQLFAMTSERLQRPHVE